MIGRKGTSRKLFMPNNTNMEVRANKILERTAAAYRDKHTTALKVDSPQFAFWRNTGGSIPCSCTHDNARQAISPGESLEAKNSTPHKTNIGKDTKAKQIIRRPGTTGVSSTPTNYLPEPAKVSKDRLNEGSFDILDALSSEDEDLIDGLSLFNRKLISCPVCLSSGMIDAWQLHGGLRLVFDTSEARYFRPSGVDINYTNKPNVISFADPEEVSGSVYSQVVWAFNPPLLWNSVPRFAVWNGADQVDTEAYSLNVTVDGTTLYPASEIDGLADIFDGHSVSLLLKPRTAFDFTHVELVFSFMDWQRGQLPEVPQAYEEEFLDWQQTLSTEVPPDTAIKEGDYLCETKYLKTWKISGVNRKETAGKTVFGLSVDLKALQSYEMMCRVLNLFGPTK